MDVKMCQIGEHVTFCLVSPTSSN